MKKALVVINNGTGLHARPASIFVNIAKKFQCDITVRKGEKLVNAKSILGILGLGATKGDELEIIIEGDDEKEAVCAIKELFHKEIRE